MTHLFTCHRKKFRVDREERYGYDFDGVIHKLMAPGETLRTEHRSPNYEMLKKFVREPLFLKKYVITKIIDDMLNAIHQGKEVYIISANSRRYKDAIYTLMRDLGVNIPKENIYMNVSPKIDKLRELDITKFIDDSGYNIKNIHRAYQEGKLPRLKKLIWVWPEEENIYDVDINSDLHIFRESKWHEKILKDRYLAGVEKIN